MVTGVLAVAIGVVWWLASRTDEPLAANDVPGVEDRQARDKGSPLRGGSGRLSDGGDHNSADRDAASKAASADPFDYGTTPTVPVDANEQVKTVVEAALAGEKPWMRSALTPPPPFDRESYERDPDAYLNTPAPGRVFQPAQPGKGVRRLSALSRTFVTVAQNKSVNLRVQAVPGAPVTFTSFDVGRFENLLTTITVRADEQGVAQTQFFGAPGTINDVNILAASPLTSGQVRFVVNVTLPDDTVPVLEEEESQGAE
ncbi:MAG: hypothetical protein DWQ42_08285 [Planctomycetota bacterium]|nr:MAG: hypothetical protein DWQ42_08285 [Planctomycetota bacterium]